MPKLEEFQQQQELNLFFKPTVAPAGSPEAKKLVEEAPFHPGYEGAAISIAPLTTQDLSTMTITPFNTDSLNNINLSSWGAQPSVITNIDPTAYTNNGNWNSFFHPAGDTIVPDKKPGGNALKFDGDKLPVNLLSSEALLQTAAVLKFGADKYAEHNWRQGFAWSRPLAAAMRHIMAFNDGEDKDPESGLSHLAHAMCCIMFLLEFEKTHRELDDRYKVDVPTTKDTSK